jgi:deoxyhypusine synthase
MTNFGNNLIAQFRASLDTRSQKTLDSAVKQIVDAKKRGGKVMVVTGSGPNIHEGVTTLIAEMIRKGLIDGVSTSSAVISHEISGSLDRVKRVSAKALDMNLQSMPRGNLFEFTLMQPSELDALEQEMIVDRELMKKADTLPVHSSIIKAAGNMAYPMGLRSELL